MFFLSFTSFAQVITGQIVNEFDKTPIFGITIYGNGMPMAFSDQEGFFEIDDISTIKKLTFSHLAFVEKTIEIGNLKKGQIIYLTEKTNLLNEVIVTNNTKTLSLKDIIKKSSDKYKESLKTEPYLVNVNAKQVVMQNNNYLGFIELDGVLYNFIPKDNNPFKYPFILPKEIRKNKEILKTKNNASKNREMFNYFGTDFFRESFFLNFQSVNISHPLLINNKYSYKQLEDVEINGDLYYQVQFFQKKGIHVKRDLFNVYGEMLISKENFTIFKHKVSFDFDDINSNELEILYDKKGNQILPSKIKLEMKLINPKSQKKGTFIQTFLTIDNSKTIATKDITKQLTFNLNYYLDELKYDYNYWSQKTTIPSTNLIDNYLKTLTEQDFENGAKQNLLNKESKYFTKEDESFRVQQIKLHEETLKNIKL
jgi:hypothetical protein